MQKIEAISINTLMDRSIYFAGKYELKNDSYYSFAGSLQMNQYSSYDEGKTVGNYKFKNCLGGNKPGGKLVRIGKNKKEKN